MCVCSCACKSVFVTVNEIDLDEWVKVSVCVHLCALSGPLHVAPSFFILRSDLQPSWIISTSSSLQTWCKPCHCTNRNNLHYNIIFLHWLISMPNKTRPLKNRKHIYIINVFNKSECTTGFSLYKHLDFKHSASSVSTSEAECFAMKLFRHRVPAVIYPKLVSVSVALLAMNTFIICLQPAGIIFWRDETEL